MFLRVDSRAHPGMDAALKFGGLPLGHEGASCRSHFPGERYCPGSEVVARAVRLPCARTREPEQDCQMRRLEEQQIPPPNSRTRVNGGVSPPRFWSMRLRPSSALLDRERSAHAPTDLYSTEFRLKTREGDHSSRIGVTVRTQPIAAKVTGSQ